ncbi:MAG: AMP-binding protein [Hyphomicrobiaceae bacterium]|nr:AMP-binding protein [Hyphomicrobiaceae bacterium]
MRDDHLFGIARHKRYAQLVRDFRWDLPETFNFGRDVVDAWASERDGLALVWENADGDAAAFRYSDIARLSNRLASSLAAAGVAKGDRVIVMLPRVPEWQIAMVACLKLGAVAIPCIEMLTSRDIAYRVENSEPKAIICRDVQVQKCAEIADKVPVRIAVGGAPGWTSWTDAKASGYDDFAAADVRLDDPALMYYTSGSTGHPKGVLHAARALYVWRMQAFMWLDLTPSDRIWCTADTGWSKAGTSIIWGPWSCGACAFFYDGPYVPTERLRLLAKHKVTVFCASSTEILRLSAEHTTAYDLSALRRTVSAGEAVNPVAAERWEQTTGCKVSEAYGQTEALMMVLNYPSEPVRYGSMGRPQPGLDIDIVDDSGVRQPAGVEGHLALLTPSPQLMLGYWKDPERTAQCFVSGPDGRWYLSGDRASKDADGYFWYQGRADDLINSAGYRIGPLEVENALLEHPAVAECAVVPSPDRDRGEIVKAFVVVKDGVEGTDALARTLQEHVKTVTAPYKYPRAIEFIAEIPKTVTGKIRRRTLKELEIERAKAGG